MWPDSPAYRKGLWRLALAVVLVRHRRIASIAAVGACLLACLGSFPSLKAANKSFSQSPIRIGVVLPLSGQAAEPGQNVLKGMELFLDEIDHKIAGRQVELVVENTGSSKDSAIDAVNKLIDKDKVPLLTGIYLTSELYAVAPIVDAKQEPLLVASAGADNVTQRQRSNWIVRTCYTGSLMSHALGQYAYKTLGYRRIITVASDYAYGYEAVGGFQETFEGAGGKIVQKIWTPLGFLDFSPSIKSMRKDADAVFMAIVGQSRHQVALQYAQMGPKLPVMGNDALFDESVIQDTGNSTHGGMSVSTYLSSLDSAANKSFVKHFTEKNDTVPGIYAANGYVAAMALRQAIESVKGNVEDKPALMAALHKINLADTPLGPIKLDKYGQAICNVYLRQVTSVGKTAAGREQLKNTLIHTFPNVSQFWTYDPEQYMAKSAYKKDYPPCKYCD